MRPTAALRALPSFLPRTLALGCAALLLGACSTTAPTPPVSAAEVGEYRAGSGILKGYLAPGEMPDSLALVAAPPATGSAAQASDEATTRQRQPWPTARAARWPARTPTCTFPPQRRYMPARWACRCPKPTRPT